MHETTSCTPVGNCVGSVGFSVDYEFTFSLSKSKYIRRVFSGRRPTPIPLIAVAIVLTRINVLFHVANVQIII